MIGIVATDIVKLVFGKTPCVDRGLVLQVALREIHLVACLVDGKQPVDGSFWRWWPGRQGLFPEAYQPNDGSYQHCRNQPQTHSRGNSDRFATLHGFSQSIDALVTLSWVFLKTTLRYRILSQTKTLQDLAQGLDVGGRAKQLGLGGLLFGSAILTGKAQIMQIALAPAEP